MYVSLSRLRVPAERAPELVAAFRRRAHLVDSAPGFVDLQVWQSDRDRTELSQARATSCPYWSRSSGNRSK
jgi:heme-degrading monooxygenase HmoA